MGNRKTSWEAANSKSYMHKQSFWTLYEKKIHQNQTGLPSEGSLVNNDINPLKNMSHDVRDHTALPGLEKQNSLLSERTGRACLCLAASLLLQNYRVQTSAQTYVTEEEKGTCD